MNEAPRELLEAFLAGYIPRGPKSILSPDIGRAYAKLLLEEGP